MILLHNWPAGGVQGAENTHSTRTRPGESQIRQREAGLTSTSVPVALGLAWAKVFERVALKDVAQKTTTGKLKVCEE